MKGYIVLTLLFVVIGVLSLALGISNYFQEQAVFAAYEPATATVTDWIPDPNYGTVDYCPVYTYTTKTGEARSYTGDNCETKPDPATIGQQQEQIYYDPKNPYSSIETRGWSGSEGSGFIFGVVGFVFFVAVGLVILLVAFLMQGYEATKTGHPSTLTTDQGSQGEVGQAQERHRKNLESSHDKLTNARIILAEIEELKALRDANQISEADFQKRKQEIISKMSR